MPDHKVTKKVQKKQVRGFENVQKCEKCPYISKSPNFMKKHTKHLHSKQPLFNCMENKPEEYSCQSCNFTTDMVRFFNQHAKEHKSVKLEENMLSLDCQILRGYVCGNCAFETYSTLHWLNHLQHGCLEIKTKVLKYYGKSLVSKEINCDKWFKCDQCSYKTLVKRSLGRHVNRKHAVGEEIVWTHCPHCPFKTKAKYQLKNHTINKHTDHESIKWQFCDKCVFRCKQRSTLFNHIKLLHTKDIKWFSCLSCSYKTRRELSLKNHEKALHSAEAKNLVLFQCDHCVYSTKVARQLKRHIEVHHRPDGDIWFKCDECGYLTKYKKKLERHLTIKHGNDASVKVFKCSRCEFETMVKDHLKVHLYKHAAEDLGYC